MLSSGKAGKYDEWNLEVKETETGLEELRMKERELRNMRLCLEWVIEQQLRLANDPSET